MLSSKLLKFIFISTEDIGNDDEAMDDIVEQEPPIEESDRLGDILNQADEGDDGEEEYF